MHRLGLAPRGDPGGVRWVAIRHADDHVHVVATLARVDGRRASTHGDYRLSRQACTYIEAKYGLVATSPPVGTAAAHPSQGETLQDDANRAATHASALLPARGRREPARVVLRRRVRTAAAGAQDLDDFFARLRADRVLVRPRLSERTPGQVTGYAVALTGDTDSRRASRLLRRRETRRRTSPCQSCTAAGNSPPPGTGGSAAARNVHRGRRRRPDLAWVGARRPR